MYTPSAEVAAAIIGGSAALVGSVVGAVLAWRAALAVERTRWSREERLRFDADRRVVYARVLASMSGFIAAHIAGVRGRELQPYQADLFSALAEVELIASPAVRKTAEFLKSAFGDKWLNPAEERLPDHALYKARNDFIGAVREELRIDQAGTSQHRLPAGPT